MAGRHKVLTPILNPATLAEERYNSSHIRTRQTVERCFGVWKRVFPCLQRGLLNRLDNIVPIICATATLHNIARLANEPDLGLGDDIDGNENDDDENVENNAAVRAPSRAGQRFRQNIIATHFN